MQEQNNIQAHPLYSLVYEMVSNPEKTEAYNQIIAEKWLTGKKEYLNGLCPAEKFFDEDGGDEEVVGYINYLCSLKGKEFISE